MFQARSQAAEIVETERSTRSGRSPSSPQRKRRQLRPQGVRRAPPEGDAHLQSRVSRSFAVLVSSSMPDGL